MPRPPKPRAKARASAELSSTAPAVAGASPPQAAYPGFAELQQLLASEQIGQKQRMERALVRLARWRQQLIVNTYRNHHGRVVFGGPFAGMRYHQATEGATAPRLIGCYEAELHPTLHALPEAGYQRIIDIGCAEGYYAVGLARLLPGCTVQAHDISETAQAACRALATENGVHVEVAGLFDPAELTLPVRAKTLVFCDTEGAEAQLLDPVRAPALREVDLIVEVHECFKPGLVKLMQERFEATHDIEWLWQSPNAQRELPDWVARLSHLDQILCTWEWRAGPTPWAVMRRRQTA